jgi:exonuclease III
MFLSQMHSQFDIIVLSEIWSHNVSFYANIFGCNTYDFFYDLPPTSKIGGVAIYVKKSLNSTVRSDLYILFYPTCKCENVWLDVCKNNKKYVIAAIYRHPNQSSANFFQHLELKLNLITKVNKTCFILGDINIDLLKAHVDSATGTYLGNIL